MSDTIRRLDEEARRRRKDAVESRQMSWPIVDLSDDAPPAPPQFIIEQLLPASTVSLMAATGGVGKSMLALTMGAHVACGRTWAGFPVRMGRVLFVSAEDPGEVVRYRLAKIIKAYNLPANLVHENLQVVDGTGHDSYLAKEARIDGVIELQETEAWADLCTRTCPGDLALVILDNASELFGGNEISRVQVKAFIRLLTRLTRHLDPEDAPTAVLLLAHVDKAGARHGTSSQSYAGSSQWGDGVRSRIALTYDNRTETVSLTQEKSNHGPKAHPVTLAWNGPVLMPTRHQAAREADAEITDEADDTAIIAAMRAAKKAGQRVTTARSGPHTALHALGDCSDIRAHFAGKDGNARFWQAMTRLRGAKVVITTSYKTDQRKTKDQLELAQEPAQNAPISAPETCADISPIPPSATGAAHWSAPVPAMRPTIRTGATGATGATLPPMSGAGT